MSKTTKRKPKEYPSVPMDIREADLPRSRAGLAWPQFEGGDLVRIEVALRNRFTTLMNKRGLRVAIEAEDAARGTLTYRLYDPKDFANRLHKGDGAQVLTRETVPADVSGRHLWSVVFTKGALAPEYLVEADLVVGFVGAANGRGYSTHAGPVDAAGMRRVVLRPKALPSPVEVRKKLLEDLGTLPGKWLLVIHDSVASKGGLERLSEHQRAVLLEGGAA